MKNSATEIKYVIALHAKYPIFLSDSNETLSYRKIFEKYSNVKFHKNPSSCSIQTQTERDMTKLIAIRTFANVPGLLKPLQQVTSTNKIGAQSTKPSTFTQFRSMTAPKSVKTYKTSTINSSLRFLGTF
jgi:hypothetical protein